MSEITEKEIKDKMLELAKECGHKTLDTVTDKGLSHLRKEAVEILKRK